MKMNRGTLGPPLSHVLCVPSMGMIQKRFKSPVDRMNRVKGCAHAVLIEEKKETATNEKHYQKPIDSGLRSPPYPCGACLIRSCLKHLQAFGVVA